MNAFSSTTLGRRGFSTWSQAWGACLPASLQHSFSLMFFSCLQYPELLVASYNNNEDAPHEPDGVALVWNMKYKKTTPEYVFHCQVLKETLAFLAFANIPPPPSRTASSMTNMDHSQPSCPAPLLPHPSCPHAHCEFTVLASTSTTSMHKHMFTRRLRRPVVQKLGGI